MTGSLVPGPYPLCYVTSVSIALERGPHIGKKPEWDDLTWKVLRSVRQPWSSLRLYTINLSSESILFTKIFRISELDITLEITWSNSIIKKMEKKTQGKELTGSKLSSS